MEQNSIVVKNVTKKFDDFMLDHISFTVPTGRIVGFIGENGAGKSTTINLILDQLKLDAGEIRILGKQNHSYLHKENIGVVFDECKFHSVLNAKDIAQILSGSYKTWDMNLFEEYMKRLDVPLNKSIGQLSKGMKMKLSIICALSHRPQILILDEATTGLDPVVRDEILDIFLEFIQDEEHSILFSTHITSDISHCSMCICPLINRLINSHTLSLSFRYLRIFLLRKYSILSFGISPSVCSFLAI